MLPQDLSEAKPSLRIQTSLALPVKELSNFAALNLWNSGLDSRQDYLRMYFLFFQRKINKYMIYWPFLIEICVKTYSVILFMSKKYD